MTRLLIFALLVLPLTGCPHGHEHDGEAHGHEHDGDGAHEHGDGHGHDHGPDSDHDHADEAPAPAIVTSVKDPVCGMAVTTDVAHVAEREGTQHYFCSAACLAKFEAPREAGDPEAPPSEEHGDGDHDH